MEAGRSPWNESTQHYETTGSRQERPRYSYNPTDSPLQRKRPKTSRCAASGTPGGDRQLAASTFPEGLDRPGRFARIRAMIEPSASKSAIYPTTSGKVHPDAARLAGRQGTSGGRPIRFSTNSAICVRRPVACT